MAGLVPVVSLVVGLGLRLRPMPYKDPERQREYKRDYQLTEQSRQTKLRVCPHGVNLREGQTGCCYC